MRRTMNLRNPFALIASVLALLFVLSLDQWVISPVAILVGALFGGWLGNRVTARNYRGWLAPLLVVSAGIAIERTSPELQAVPMLVVILLFFISLPFFAAIAAARQTGFAREGSLLDRVERRSVYLASLLPLDLYLVLLLSGWQHIHGWRTTTIAIVWLSSKLAFVIVDLSQLAFIHRFAQDRAKLQPAEPRVSDADVDRIVDLGLGDDRYEHVLHGSGGYRDGAKRALLYVGDPIRARAEIYHRVTRHLTLLAISAAPFAWVWYLLD